jgi:photosystem II stability/assembly factor-like uncharacterized protein
MLAIATPLLTLALGATDAPRNPIWIPAGESAPCDLTDVDFSDRLHGFATCAFGDAMTTDDGGLSWTVFGTDLQQSLLFAYAESTDELYAARLGFYHSIDRGETWEELGGLSNNFGSVFDVYFGENEHFVAIQGGTLLHSDNGGVEWDTDWPETQGVFFDELHFPSALIGYASGGITTDQGSAGSILRTIDGGDHWTLLSFTHGEITAADFIDDDHGVVATQPGELYATDDGGDSWTLIGPAPDGSILLDLAHRDAAHWYGVSYEGCVYETRDAGVTWETGYCDPVGNALAALTLRAGPAVAGGNSGVVLYENRVLENGFD